MLRLLCHILIQRMPDEGLAEVSESVADLCQFYTTPALPPNHPPARETRPFHARFAGTESVVLPPVTDLD